MSTRSRSGRAFAAAVLCGALLAACGGGKSSTGGGPTLTVGVLTDQSGLAASEFATAVEGIKAGIGVAGTEGYRIRYVLADTQTTPAGALTAAQKLVEQDHVFAVISVSSLAFAAADYLTSKGIPVVGASFDGPEWMSPAHGNMFSVFGNIDYSKVTTVSGEMLRKLGATTYGGIGYGISPSSAGATRAGALSAQAAGLKVGYYDADFPFGGTNVGPVALAMKNHGVDGVLSNVVPSTGFALITALKQYGVKLHAAVLLTGYGGDLLQSGGPALQEAQGDYFVSTFQPIEMHTAATEKLAQAMKTYAGVTGDPTFAQYIGYVAIDGFVQGLKAAGPNPSQAALIRGLNTVTDYHAAGLWGNDFSVDFHQRSMSEKSCEWVTQLSGASFRLVPGLDPICGQIIPGVTVPSS